MRGKLLIVICVAALLAVVGVVVFVWHPWIEEAPSELAETPMAKTYVDPDTEQKPVNSESMRYGDMASAVDGWDGITAKTDIRQSDWDKGFLPMDESLSEYQARRREELGLTDVDPLTITEQQLAESYVVDSSGVEKFIVRKHNWLEYAKFNVGAVKENDGTITLSFSGNAFNGTALEHGAEGLPPIFVDGKACAAYLAEDSIVPGKAANFVYKAEGLKSGPIDLTIYGITVHVDDVKAVSSGTVVMDSPYRTIEYPNLNQDFVNQIAEWVGWCISVSGVTSNVS